VVAAWGAYSDGKVANRDVREALEPAAAGALPVVAAWHTAMAKLRIVTLGRHWRACSRRCAACGGSVAYSDGKVANRDVREALESLQPQVRCLWWQRGIQRWQSCES
jgi:hypothetical protein